MRRRGLLMTAIALAMMVMTSSCASLSTLDTVRADGRMGQSTLTIASVSDNNSFDPAALEIGHRVQYWMPVYDTLLLLDEEGELHPNLVTRWSYSDDATVLNLRLREGITFTDGEPFNAMAVRANMEHLSNGGGQNAYMTASIVDYGIVDEYELNLVLSAPDPGFLGYLGVVGGAMASPASLVADDLATHPIGSGPYILDRGATSAGKQYVYLRNDDYWNPDAFPYDEIVIKPIIGAIARLNALKSGQVDATVAVPANMAEAEASGLRVHTSQVNWMGLIIADRAGTKVPALADARVRRAINMAIDGEAILEHVALGEGSITDQIFNPKSGAFDSTLDRRYPYDLQRAKQLLVEAGYADGFHVTMPDIAAYDRLLPFVDQALAELSITVDWKTETPNTVISALISGQYPMFIVQLGSQSAWQDIQKAALPSSPWNPFRIDDDELAGLLVTVQNSSADDRPAAMRAVNEWLVENAWFAPWYRENTIYLTGADTEVVMPSQNVVPWIRAFAPVS